MLQINNNLTARCLCSIGCLADVYYIQQLRFKGCKSNRPLPNWQKLSSWYKTKCQSCPHPPPLIIRGERRKVLAPKIYNSCLRHWVDFYEKTEKRRNNKFSRGEKKRRETLRGANKLNFLWKTFRWMLQKINSSTTCFGWTPHRWAAKNLGPIIIFH
jgi:hypothetical protein